MGSRSRLLFDLMHRAYLVNQDDAAALASKDKSVEALQASFTDAVANASGAGSDLARQWGRIQQELHERELLHKRLAGSTEDHLKRERAYEEAKINARDVVVLVVGFMLGHWLFGPLDHLLSFVIPSR